MEIEAKFKIPDVETQQRLQSVESLAGFALSTGRTHQVHDTYLDTAGRSILAAGYTCRKRERDGQIIMTLKQLNSPSAAVHRRQEFEVILPSQAPPAQWPDGEARQHVLTWVGHAPLLPLFDLSQTRIVRAVSQGKRTVAELSLDDAHIIAGDREQAFYELEVELKTQGTEDDLATIVSSLQSEWGLQPETRSKFERALELVSTYRLLTPNEQTLLMQIATRDDRYGRRARALLALNERTTQVEAGRRAGLSERRVRYWLAAFRLERLSIFPRRVLEPVTPVPEAERQPAAPIQALLERFSVNQVHARAVAEAALELFDRLLPFHRLPVERRVVLEMAALTHDIGLVADASHHRTAGRDILLSAETAGIDQRDRRVMSVAAFLHTKRITPDKLDQLSQELELAEPLRTEALALASLVRMADGLVYTHTHSRLGELHQQEGLVELEVIGPRAAADAEQTQKSSDLWRLLFGLDLRFKPITTVTLGGVTYRLGVLRLPLLEHPGLNVDDAMTEAGRKTLYFHFQRMLYYEPGTRLGEDIEELHHMRVATRRMRAAVRVFQDHLDPAAIKPFVKALRRTGRALGAVRDLDVFRLKTQLYLDQLPPERQGELEPLLAAWQVERDQARMRMLTELDSDLFTHFKEQFDVFLQTPGAGAWPVVAPEGEPLPHRVRHVAPVALYQHLAAVRAFDEWIIRPDTPLVRFHQLRIAFKGLRYTLEFFHQVLGSEVKSLIQDIKVMQDHLGDLQDAVVTCNLLRDFLTWGTWSHAETDRSIRPAEPIVAPGVASYLAARQAELWHLVSTFSQAWLRIISPDFSQRVAAAVADL